MTLPIGEIVQGDCPDRITGRTVPGSALLPTPGKLIAAAAVHGLVPALHTPPYRTAREILLGGWAIGATVDVLVVEPTRLHIYEVKSNKDSVSRIPLQIEKYMGQAHSLTFIAEDKISVARVERALHKAATGWPRPMKPTTRGHGSGECYDQYPAESLGLIVATRHDSGYSFEVIRKAQEQMPENECFLLSAYTHNLRELSQYKQMKPKPRGKWATIKAVAASLSQEQAAGFVAEIVGRRCDDPL